MKFFVDTHILFVLALALSVSLGTLGPQASISPKLAWAAEESEGSEEDEESESSEYSDSGDDEEKSTETVTRTYTVMEQFEETVLVTPPAYLSDRDGDSLVDAIDPNPDTHQKEFFTDDDGDSIANAYDQFPGLDDLVTFADETDENENGVIDRYES